MDQPLPQTIGCGTSHEYTNTPGLISTNQLWNIKTTPNILYTVCASGAGAGRFCCTMSLTFLFCNKEMDMLFLKDVGPIRSKVRCNVRLWYVLATAFQMGSWCQWCLHCSSWRLHCGVPREVRNIMVQPWAQMTCWSSSPSVPHSNVYVCLWHTVHAMKLFRALLHV